jgi:L-alanine-DL-glutamate epimerase-like enolase superfamily enzyme
MPWTLHLFEEVPLLANGEIHVPVRPGLGLTFNRDALKRYTVA